MEEFDDFGDSMSSNWDYDHGDDVFGFQFESVDQHSNKSSAPSAAASKSHSKMEDSDDEDDYSDISFSDTKRANRDQAHSWDEECDLCGTFYTGSDRLSLVDDPLSVPCC
jgi:hypothetical protein